MKLSSARAMISPAFRVQQAGRLPARRMTQPVPQFGLSLKRFSVGEGMFLVLLAALALAGRNEVRTKHQPVSFQKTLDSWEMPSMFSVYFDAREHLDPKKYENTTLFSSPAVSQYLSFYLPIKSFGPGGVRQSASEILLDMEDMQGSLSPGQPTQPAKPISRRTLLEKYPLLAQKESNCAKCFDAAIELGLVRQHDDILGRASYTVTPLGSDYLREYLKWQNRPLRK